MHHLILADLLDQPTLSAQHYTGQRQQLPTKSLFFSNFHTFIHSSLNAWNVCPWWLSIYLCISYSDIWMKFSHLSPLHKGLRKQVFYCLNWKTNILCGRFFWPTICRINPANKSLFEGLIRQITSSIILSTGCGKLYLKLMPLWEMDDISLQRQTGKLLPIVGIN